MNTSKVNGVRCLDCGDLIWSRHRHDMVWCRCKKVAVDGGTEYIKVSFAGKQPEHIEILLDENSKPVGYIKCKVERQN
jgi:hypothetical protein